MPKVAVPRARVDGFGRSDTVNPTVRAVNITLDHTVHLMNIVQAKGPADAGKFAYPPCEVKFRQRQKGCDFAFTLMAVAWKNDSRSRRGPAHNSSTFAVLEPNESFGFRE